MLYKSIFTHRKKCLRTWGPVHRCQQNFGDQHDQLFARLRLQFHLIDLNEEVQSLLPQTALLTASDGCIAGAHVHFDLKLKAMFISTIGSLVESNNYSKSQENPMFSRVRCSFVRVKPAYFIVFSAETQHCFLFYSWIGLFLVSNHQVFHLKPPRLFLKSQNLTQTPSKTQHFVSLNRHLRLLPCVSHHFFPLKAHDPYVFLHVFPACARTKSSSSRSACGHCKALPQQLMAAPQARLSTFEINWFGNHRNIYI